MRVPLWRILTVFAGLALSTACNSTLTDSGSDARITLLAQFEKHPPSTLSQPPITTQPARYCWAEVRDVSSNALLASGYLGSDGSGAAIVPRGLQIYVRIYAQYQVPCADPNSFFMRGSVKNAPPLATTVDSAAFAAIPNWYVTSNAFSANQDGTLSVTALTSNGIAGAFNIADQAVTFASAVRDMDGPSTTLRLPNLHTFWTSSTNPADQRRSYPEAQFTPLNTLLATDSGRAVFTHSVYSLDSGSPNTESDAWDDGVLQETFARLLFADYSLKADGSSALSLLRRDNDNVYVTRYLPSESTVAFVAGFSDFLAGAIRNSPLIQDSYVDGNGVRQVDTFDLSDHTMVSPANKGEFTRGSIAVSLWGFWKNANALGGTAQPGPDQPPLRTLWAALRSTTAYADGTGEYEQATLGCYPTYLQGVATRVSTPVWTIVLNELALESVANPNAAYFAGNALWLTRSLAFSDGGSLQTYDANQNLYYDRNQSQAWRFVQSAAGPRTLTMNPTGGQDFYLELLGPGGLVDGSYGTPGSIRTLTFTSLPKGTYVARVRVGATTGNGLYPYTLSVN